MHHMLRAARYTDRRRGLTLIEMLVAVAILAVLILSFTVILSASQRVVSVSQANMRKNSIASALSQTARTDLRRVTQNGFLCVAETDSGPVLVFTQAGLAESITSANTGTGSIVTMGLCDTDGMDESVLFRRGMVLNDDGIDSGDMEDRDLSLFLALPRSDPGTPTTVDSVEEYIERALSDAPSSLAIPIQNQSDLEDLWQALAPGCTELTIRWTNGDKGSDGLKWYGPGRSSGDSDVEYTVGGKYRALWTNENQANWPVAIKLTFTIKDITLSQAARDESDGNEYEVICTIGK